MLTPSVVIFKLSADSDSTQTCMLSTQTSSPMDSDLNSDSGTVDLDFLDSTTSLGGGGQRTNI